MAKTANTKDLRRANRNALYRAIYQNTGITRPELALKTQGSLPTIIHNVKSLIDDGLVCENGSQESTGGRKAATLSIVRGARLAVGADITLDHIAAALVGLDGEIITRTRKSVPFSPEPAYLDELADVVDGLIAASGCDRRAILGAGISIPGILSARVDTVNSHALSLSSYPLQPITDRLDMDCLFSNDANAASIAEAWKYGRERSFIYLSLKDAVGGALVWEGWPLLGDNQRCGEFGHVTVERAGLLCYCGKKGCLDAYCSALNLSERTGGDLSLFFERLKNGDPRLRILWSGYLDYLATAVNMLRTALDYDVVLGGDVGAFMEAHIDDLRGRVAALDTFASPNSYIQPCQYKVEASAVGAALMHICQFISAV